MGAGAGAGAGAGQNEPGYLKKTRILMDWLQMSSPRPLSVSTRRKIRAENMIKEGLHPFGMKLREPRGETCKTCNHSVAKRLGNIYWKCDLMNNTGGPGTDLRLKWPACQLWESA